MIGPAFDRKGSRMKRLVFALATCVALGWMHPGLAAERITSFETDDWRSDVVPAGVRAERVREHATEGQWALKLDFKGSTKDTWPGFGIVPHVDTTQFQLVAFDVYQPDAAPVGLSCRIDFEDGSKKFVSGVTIPGRSPFAAEIWIGGLAKIQRIYPYIRMPRRDYTLYIDNLRWATMNSRFTALHYVDDRPPPAPDKAEKKRGFLLFQRAFTDVVFPNSIPRPEERLREVRLFATPGETTAVCFSLRALRSLKDVRVRFAGVPATGEVLPVRCLNKRVTYSAKEYIVDMPVLCERRAAVDVAAATSKRFVVDLTIDKKAPAKTYRGRLSIAVAGQTPVEVPLLLRVLPFTLAEPDTMMWGEYYQGPKLAKTEAEKRAFLVRDLRDMRAHGMTSVGLCFGPERETFHWNDDGSLTLDPAGSLYETFMDTYARLGFPAPVIQLADTGQIAAGMTGASPDDPTWGKAYQTFWRAMQALHRRRGWPEVIVQPVDEPGWQGREEKERNVRCLKLLKEIPGMRTEQDGPGDAYFRREAGPFADVWNYNGGIDKPEEMRKIKAAGKIVLLYNCDVESYRPEVDRYVAGWFQAASGAQGSFNWAYMSWRGSPYDDNDHKIGTWMHVYPPMGNEPGGPSTGWIGSREGIDDYRYIHTLRTWIERARAAGSAQARTAAAEAEAELAAVVATIAYSPRVRSQARWTRRGWTPAGERSIGGTLKLANGWQHGEYEKARWRVARATLDVMAAMGKFEENQAGRAASPPPNAALLTRIAWREDAARTAGAAGKGTGSRVVSIPVWNTSPVLDGKLDDPIWKNAAKLDPFTLMDGSAKPRMPTDVLVGTDGKDLWLGITCHEDTMDFITAGITKNGGPVWQDDCVEVFVDQNLDHATFRQILVNSLGTQAWMDSTDPAWKAASRVATRSHDDRWVVELAIPLADLGITGSRFGFNVCRERRPMESLELSCWSPTGAGFGVPGRFGVAGLGHTWIGELDVPPASLGTNHFTVTLHNETAKSVTLTQHVLLTWKKHKKELTAGTAISLAPGATRTRSVDYDLPEAEAPVITFTVKRADDPAKVLDRRTFSPAVQAPLSMNLRPRMYYLSENRGALELEVNLAPETRRRSRLVLTMAPAEGNTPVRRQTLSSLAGNRLDARLDLTGLPEGTYTLEAVLLGPKGTSLTSASTRVYRLRGPFAGTDVLPSPRE